MIEKMKPENGEAKQKVARKNGKFVKGCSGNPKGKPKGLKHKFTIANLQALDDAAKEFEGFKGANFWEGSLNLAVKLAKKGNVILLCKLIDKLVPNKTAGDGPEETPEELPFLVRAFDAGSRN